MITPESNSVYIDAVDCIVAETNGGNHILVQSHQQILTPTQISVNTQINLKYILTTSTYMCNLVGIKALYVLYNEIAI